MSSSSTATKVTTTRGSSDAGTVHQSPIYKCILTPIIFVSFLLSLAWVDLKYTITRSRNHGGDHGSGWMPAWLHNIAYKRSPYHYLQLKESKTPSPHDEQGEWFYHSKQKKLMRMEVDDAFEMRGHVLVVLGLFSLAMVWCAWLVSSWAWRSVHW
ncbi:hypothetical protein CCHL11_08693 [Colletotrichum chlorophyti]|uniref:Uncharacterized protein n=1 Tax=Colletotrichum chlorophyti TaxID=708187 RepID=A0A1Q8RC87_9PEZI|nr:hypothetical protein CCHL11_08693 [Colletotrichum chlorophyti]